MVPPYPWLPAPPLDCAWFALVFFPPNFLCVFPATASLVAWSSEYITNPNARDLLVSRSSTTCAFDSKSFEFGLVKISPTRCFPSNFVCKKKAKLYGHVCCKHDVLARAEYNGRSRRESGGGDFLAGFLLGGVVFGALGFLFAPQISKTLWSGDEDGLRKKLPRRMDDDEGLEKTRKTLNEKIAQLNSAIDDVSAQLRAADGASDSAPGASEVESAA